MRWCAQLIAGAFCFMFVFTNLPLSSYTNSGTEEDREVASDSCGQGSPGEMGN